MDNDFLILVLNDYKQRLRMKDEMLDYKSWKIK